MLAEKKKVRDRLLRCAYRSVTHQWTKQAASKGELVLFCFVLDFLGDFPFMCMCVRLCAFIIFIPCVQEPMEVERISDPLRLDCHTQL